MVSTAIRENSGGTQLYDIYFLYEGFKQVLLVNQNEIVHLCQSSSVIPNTCLIVYSRRRRDGLFRPILSPCKLNIFFPVHTSWDPIILVFCREANDNRFAHKFLISCVFFLKNFSVKCNVISLGFLPFVLYKGRSLARTDKYETVTST